MASRKINHILEIECILDDAHVELGFCFNNEEKYSALDFKRNEPEEILSSSKGTRKPSTRAERRKETTNAKNRRKRLSNYSINYIMPNSGKVKDTGLKPYFKGDKVYKRTHNYMWGEDTREPEIVLVKEDDLSDVWEDYQNNPYFPDPDPWEDYGCEWDEDPIESENQKTFMNLYVISHSYLYDFDYITKEYIVVGYNKAKDLYHKIFCNDDEDVALFTTKVNEDGIISTNKLIILNDEDEE